jgi:hypothetical protein
MKRKKKSLHMAATYNARIRDTQRLKRRAFYRSLILLRKRLVMKVF